MMLPVAMAVKLGLAALIPKAVETAWDYVFGDDEPEVPMKKVHKPRKKSDTTRMSALQRKLIKQWHTEFLDGNIDNINTQVELTAFINYQLGLDKGVSSYRKVWSPKKYSTHNDIPLEG